MAGKKRPRLLIKAGTPAAAEPSRWHSGGSAGLAGPGHFPSFSTHKMRSMAAAGLGEMNAIQREVSRMSRTQPENRAAPIERHVITAGDVTFGLGLEFGDEQRIQMLVATTNPDFNQKTQTQRIAHARGRLMSVLRDAMKHVSPDTREEVVKRALAYWKRNHQTDYGKAPTIRFRGGAARKSMSDDKPKFVISAERFALSKGIRGGKYFKRVPTGNPKRPYRYYYSREQYEREHPQAEEQQHISGKRAKKARALKKLRAALQSGGTVKNSLNQSVSVSNAERFWVKGTDFGLPDQTVNVHVKRVVGKNRFGEAIREYTPERTKLHNQLVDKATAGVKRVPAGKKPVAIVMMGGGGAGKGTLIKSVVGDHGDFVHVDPDDVKGDLPEYQEAMGIATFNGKPITAKDAAWMAHEESSDIGEKILEKGIQNRQNLIVDGTGKNAQKHADKIKALKEAGYHVRLLYAHTEMEEAVKRAAGRADRSGRYVPIPVLEDAHTKIPGNFEFVARHADEFALFRSERPPKTLWTGGRGQADVIHDAGEVKAFKTLGKKLHAQRGISLPPIPEHLRPGASAGKGSATAAAKSFAAALAFWDELRKGDGDPPSLSMEEMLARIKKDSHRYPPDTTPENATEGMEEELREDAREVREGPMLAKSFVHELDTDQGAMLVYRPPRRIDLEWK